MIVTSAPQPYPKAESTISPPHGLGFPWIPDLAPPSGTWSPSTWNWLPGGDKAWATWARSERLARVPSPDSLRQPRPLGGDLGRTQAL